MDYFGKKLAKYFIVTLGLILLTGCGNLTDFEGGDQEKGLSFSQAVSQAVAFYFTSETGAYRVEVKEDHQVDFLKEQFSAAAQTEQPGETRMERDLIIVLPGGEDAKYSYSFNDIQPEKPAYVADGGTWYEVSGSVTSFFGSMAEYPDAVHAICPEDFYFLKEYGWTASFLINSFEVSLPEILKHSPGEFPEVLYWAYNNELNRDTGLDLSPFLGKDVEVHLYKVAELLPEFIHGPRRGGGRAVIVRYQDEIIGAWLDIGRHHAFACSLAGRPLEEITQKEWEEWIKTVIDPHNPLEQQLARLAPEEVIHQYYRALDRGDPGMAYACLSRKNLISFLFSNMDNNYLYNPGFEDNFHGSGLGNITAAEVIEIQRLESLEDHHYPVGTQLYQVKVNLEVKKPVTHQSGTQMRFISLKRETPETGWRIDGIGTGP